MIFEGPIETAHLPVDGAGLQRIRFQGLQEPLFRNAVTLLRQIDLAQGELRLRVARLLRDDACENLRRPVIIAGGKKLPSCFEAAARVHQILSWTGAPSRTRA